MLEEWLVRYESESPVNDIEDYLDDYRNEKRVFTETFFPGQELVEPNARQIWALFDRLWAISETHQLGNPDKILEYGTKGQLARQMWYMVKGVVDRLTPNAIVASGPFRGVGESMRTEILYKLFPQQYPVKNWKSEITMVILFDDVDFVNGDYKQFIEYGNRVLKRLRGLRNVSAVYDSELAYAFLDHFLGNYMYWHEINQTVIAIYKDQFGHDLSP